MPLSIGIVGLPNVGKSTLFNCLTEKKAEAANYPFCTIDPNVGVVEVPDERLEKINKISNSKKLIPTTIEFVDIAGLVRDAHKGEGLGNQFLANIRECDAICEVVRDFQDDNIVHVDNKVDAESDRETINLELIFADLATVEKRFDKLAREAKSGDKNAKANLAILEKIKNTLEASQAVRSLEFNEEEGEFVRSLHLLTSKPILYVLNSDHDGDLPSNWDGEVLRLNVKLESEIAQLPREEQIEYIQELGLSQSGLDKLIQSSYKLLSLLTFFTTGPEETRAWTVSAGSTAPQAAGVIHSDIEEGFIRAEVVSYAQFIEAGGEQKARESGLLRTEGKNYILQDGDICHFLHNK